MIEIIITIAIFLSLNLLANQKYKQDSKDGKMLSCIELGILYYIGDSVAIDKRKAMLAFSNGCDISEHDAYCFKYYELKAQGYDNAK